MVLLFLITMVACCDVGFVQPALRRVKLEGPRTGKICWVTYYRPMHREYSKIEDSKHGKEDRIVISDVDDSATEFETESD